MRKEVAKKWIKALRSGKYKQGQEYLKYYNQKHQPRHCCLGVLCELYNDEMKKNHKKTLSIKTDFDGSPLKNGYVKFDGKHDFLPSVVRKWAGIKNRDGKINRGSYNSLAGMNDSGKTFKTISNVIEKNVENL